MFAINTNLVPSIVLLFTSNIFMFFTWYGHLKYTNKSTLFAIFTTWGIAFFEYCLQVPANKIDHKALSPAELKTIQELITFFVFVVFSYFYLKQPIKIMQVLGFAVNVYQPIIVIRSS